MSRFLHTPPARKGRHKPSKLTQDGPFKKLVEALHIGVERAAILYDPGDAKRLGVGMPARVAADRLRRLIREEKLPYRVVKYRERSDLWVVAVQRKSEVARGAEEGESERSKEKKRSA